MITVEASYYTRSVRQRSCHADDGVFCQHAAAVAATAPHLSPIPTIHLLIYINLNKLKSNYKTKLIDACNASAHASSVNLLC